jgi:hypothetical protein
VHFCRVCLGLEAQYPVEDHAGHHGVMLGLLGRTYLLERARRAGVEGTPNITFDDRDRWHLELVPVPGL